jgi:glycosyltransferase involved in cell wall biosynthesis
MPRPEAKASFGLASERPVVLMISADLTQAHKVIDLAIQAILGAKGSSGLQALLLGHSAPQIASSIPSIQSVCAYASDDNTLARACRAADITLIPSLGENFPYVALESMACRTPVIAFPVGGMPEMIGQRERGIVRERINAGEMSRHLATLVADQDLRERMGSRAAAWVREHRNMPKYLKSVAHVYERVLRPAEQTSDTSRAVLSWPM